ncbi:MAG: TIGR00725 family protein [Micromonosporaceae bacterium]
MPAVQVAVCGPSICTPEEERAAFEVGRRLAQRGHIVLCGGGGGVMAAAAAGAHSAEGLVVGVRPGRDPGEAAPHLSVVISTNLGEARNAVLVGSAHAVIVVGGSWGTLSEVALAMRRARDGGPPVVVYLGGWRVLDAAGHEVPGLRTASTPDEAVALAVGHP